MYDYHKDPLMEPSIAHSLPEPPLKVAVHLTIEVDRRAWNRAYGPGESAAEIRDGVKTIFEMEGMGEHIFAPDSGVRIVKAK